MLIVLISWVLWRSSGLPAQSSLEPALSWISGKWLPSLLYGVQPFDPKSMIAALALLLAAGIAAAAIPMIRAIRLDPASTLRQE